MDEGKLFGRGISFPPRLGTDGRLAWSAGAQNIRESIQVILLTEQQERLMMPEFGGGLKSFLFRPNTTSTYRLIQDRITRALARWEPRISVESVTVEPHPEDDQAALVSIYYKLVATQAREQQRLSVRLSP
jgi:hypothetical protein